MKLLVVHGPNLNLLGEREPEIYGDMTLTQLNRRIREVARKNKVTVRFFQSNHEGEILDFVQRNRFWADGMVINPAAFTHYSIAIRDVIAAMSFPTVEVHLSNIKTREAFRRKSVVRAVCVKQISGKGWKSYTEGVEYLVKRSRSSSR